MQTINEFKNEIDKLYLDNTLAMRVIRGEVKRDADKVSILAYQCNMARMKTTDIKLPTFIEIIADANGIIKDISLYDNFKGSQGMVCSGKYLDKTLKSYLLNKNINSDFSILKYTKNYHCRHTYEVVAAGISFYHFLVDGKLDYGSFLNKTVAYECEAGLEIKDELVINDDEYLLKENVHFNAKDLKMLSNGKIGAIDAFKLDGNFFHNGLMVDDFVKEISPCDTASKVTLNMMRLFNCPWKMLGRIVGKNRNFYFTNLVPSSFYGVLIQAISLILFPNNYNYFQHTMAGLQREDNIPLCSGMVINFDEINEFYPDLIKYI